MGMRRIVASVALVGVVAGAAACSSGGGMPAGGQGGSGAATGGSGPTSGAAGAAGGGGGRPVTSGSGGDAGGPASSGSGGAGGRPAVTGVGGAAGRRSGTGGAGGSVAPTGTAGASGAAGMPGAADVCARWVADRADLSEGTWTGDVASCSAGDIGDQARANALRLVNLYRWLAALPPVVTDPTKDMQDQQCALMMRANNMISHTPPTSWTCYTQAGADAAGSSNVSSGPAVSSVDGYMIDPGNATTIGHRRWILSNSLGPIGIGGTDRASCMWTLNGTGKVNKAWTAWPAPGVIPLQALTPARGTGIDSTGWTVQSDSIDLAAAQVTVTVDGASQPVTVTQLDANYGSRYAIRFNPMGWTTQAGKTYSVSVTGIPTAISYDVQVVSCM